MAPSVSVVIPLWNGKPHIAACLASLRAQTLPADEVVVVDNASPDGAGDLVARGFPEARLLRQGRNLGFAGGVNAGLRAARGELLVTLNQDLTCDPRFLEAMVAAQRAGGARCGMVASKMLYFQDRSVINSTGVEVLQDFYCEDRGGFERDLGQWDQAGEVFGPCGGAALYTRALLDDVGLFDEDFFCYFEDVDLAWRARLAGWRCAYAPDAVVHHKHRGSEALPSPDATPMHIQRWCARNRVWMVLKNASLGTLLLRAPVLLAREASEVVGAVGQRDASVLRGKAEALRALEGTLAKRRAVQATRRVPERELRSWMRRPPLARRLQGPLPEGRPQVRDAP
ncbi:MAG: glycosyltransferase family 2 protein [Halobacteriales archaeon]|nr:glycosyltransferase family 2 protein [Halobacteriales archaeon]